MQNQIVQSTPPNIDFSAWLEDPENEQLATTILATNIANQRKTKRDDINKKAKLLIEDKNRLDSLLLEQRKHDDVEHMFEQTRKSGVLRKANIEFIKNNPDAKDYCELEKKLKLINSKLTAINKEGRDNGLKKAIYNFQSTNKKNKKKKKKNVENQNDQEDEESF